MKKQQGMTLISWVIVLGMIAFLATIVIRILPMYQEYFGVVHIMEEELTNNKLTKAQANLLLMKRFDTGYITSVKKDNIEISRGKNSTNVTKIVIDYEVREPFIAQIDLIGHFHKEIDVEPQIRR